MELLRRYLPGGRSLRILDVGCGAGLFFERLSELGSVQGVETDLTMRTSRPEIDDRIHWGPLETLSAHSTFDAVLMLDMLEHLPDPLPALRRARDLVAGRGFLLATVPAFRALWTNHDDLNEHFDRYTKGSFEKLLRAAGWRVMLMRYFFHWTFPVKLAVRMAEAVNPRRRAASGLPGIPSPPLNHALYLVSRLEQKLLTPIGVPLGSSLLAVATRG